MLGLFTPHVVLIAMLAVFAIGALLDLLTRAATIRVVSRRAGLFAYGYLGHAAGEFVTRLAMRWGWIARRIRVRGLALAGAMVPTNIGGHVRTFVGTVSFAGTTTRNGAGIDRDADNSMYLSAVLQLNYGVAIGSPTSFTVDAKIQHGSNSDGSTGMADYTDPTTNAVAAIAQVAITGNGTGGVVEKDVNLINANRYLRVVETVAITGGSTPNIPVGTLVTLGGSSKEPI